jgi:hypothetical protein
MIAGKTVESARVTLEAQKGIGKVNIQVNGTTLPSNPEQIAFFLQPVAGFQDNGPEVDPLLEGAQTWKFESRRREKTYAFTFFLR